VVCSPWGLEESDTTERLHFHFSLACIGEGKKVCSKSKNARVGIHLALAGDLHMLDIGDFQVTH